MCFAAAECTQRVVKGQKAIWLMDYSFCAEGLRFSVRPHSSMELDLLTRIFSPLREKGKRIIIIHYKINVSSGLWGSFYQPSNDGRIDV